MQDLKKTLDASVLAIATVQGNEGHIVALCGQVLDKVRIGDVKEIYGHESCLPERLLAGTT